MFNTPGLLLKNLIQVTINTETLLFTIYRPYGQLKLSSFESSP